MRRAPTGNQGRPAFGKFYGDLHARGACAGHQRLGAGKGLRILYFDEWIWAMLLSISEAKAGM